MMNLGESEKICSNRLAPHWEYDTTIAPKGSLHSPIVSFTKIYYFALETITVYCIAATPKKIELGKIRQK